MQKNDKTLGFTLVEIIVVISLITVLATLAFIAINPQKNFADQRNATRESAINEILGAVNRYITAGNPLSELGLVPTCPSTAYIGTNAKLINLKAELVPQYISTIPTDPLVGTDNDSGYTICQTTSHKITIVAPNIEIIK